MMQRSPLLQETPPASRPLKVHFDGSACGTLRSVLTGSPYFTEADPVAADLVIFGSDEIAYVNASELYKAFPGKSISITESDIPTFRLPGLYASNTRSWITRSRTRTVNYFLSQIDRPNLEVRQRIGHASEKRYLYSFMGGSNSWTRKRLLRSVPSRPDTLIQATDSYNHWNADKSPETKALQRQRYAEVMAASRYILCPQGCGVSSYRLFESMSLGIAPVILSDKWRPVEGVDWSFALFVPERRLKEIDRIVRQHADEWEGRGQIAQQTYNAFFAPEVVPQRLHEHLLALLATRSPVSEGVMAVVTGVRAATRQAYWNAYGVVKILALKGFHLTNVAVPIPLNRPVEEQLKTSKRA